MADEVLGGKLYGARYSAPFPKEGLQLKVKASLLAARLDNGSELLPQPQTLRTHNQLGYESQ